MSVIRECSRRPWTAEDVAELKDLYENGGDKACLPIRIIAIRLGRSEAAVWSKLQRVYANAADVVTAPQTPQQRGR